MSLAWLFFSFDGRINRAIWWLVIIGTGLLDAALYLLLIDWENPTLALIAGLAIVALRLAPGVKRLHDRGKSGAWIVLYYGAPQLALILSPVGTAGDPTLGLVAIAALGVLIWAIVDLGVLPGTPGPNRYGPDPLAGRRPGGSI